MYKSKPITFSLNLIVKKKILKIWPHKKIRLFQKRIVREFDLLEIIIVENQELSSKNQQNNNPWEVTRAVIDVNPLICKLNSDSVTITNK